MNSHVFPTHFSLADITVLAGTAGVGGMAPPTSTMICARLKRVQEDSSAANVRLACVVPHRPSVRATALYAREGATALDEDYAVTIDRCAAVSRVPARCPLTSGLDLSPWHGWCGVIRDACFVGTPTRVVMWWLHVMWVRGCTACASQGGKHQPNRSVATVTVRPPPPSNHD